MGAYLMYSSTSLSGPAASGCWRQLDFSELNTPSLFSLEFRSYIGISAHAVLQICADRRADTEEKTRAIAEEVGNILIRDGREFRGRTEAPLPADDVWSGVDIAVQYLLARGLPLEADDLIAESDVKHPTIPYRALIDLRHTLREDDEEYMRNTRVVTDYKSSWQAGPDELGTLQRWSQAVVEWRNLPPDHDIDIIQQRIVNIRTWTEYTRDIHLHDPDAEYTVADLERWEKRIGEFCRTADLSRYSESNRSAPLPDEEPPIGPRPANPGVGCLSCAWRHVCEDAWAVGDIPTMGGEALATELATVEGRRSVLIAAIKAMGPEEPITISGGWVGFKEQHERIIKDGVERGILDEWLSRTACEIPEADIPVLVSLLSALGLSKGNLDSLAKRLMPERVKGIRQLRDDYVESLTVEKRTARFGVWRDK